MTSTSIDVSGLDFVVYEDYIEYTFQVSFGPYRWTIAKVYDDFVELHKELCGLYTAQHVPYLTGEVAFWKRTRRATGDERLPKLEGYLSELAHNAAEWHPRGLVVQVPHPDGSGRLVAVNKFVFDFLEFSLWYKPTVSETPLVLAGELSPDAAAVNASQQLTARHSTSEPRSRASSNGPMSEERVTPPASTSASAATPHIGSPVAAAAASGESLPMPTRTLVDDSIASSASITSQIRVHVRNFTIHPKDRIDYNIHVSLCGHSWSFPKRYSEFEQFHQELTAVYGAVCVPNIEGAKAPFWRRFDPEIATMRQRFFEAFLREVIRDIDSWEPPLRVGLQLSRKKADGEGTERVRIFVSKQIFEFFLFCDHISDLSADMADEVVQRNRATLPTAVKQVIQHNKNVKQRLQIRATMEKRQKARLPLDEATLEELCHFLRALDDDKDVLNVIDFFIREGWVNQDIEALEIARATRQDGPTLNQRITSMRRHEPDWDVVSSADQSPALTPRDFRNTMSSRRFVMESAAAASARKIGMSSEQLVRVSKAIFFDDTRRAAIKMLAAILRDDDDLDAVMDTVIYEWEPLREQVETILASGST